MDDLPSMGTLAPYAVMGAVWALPKVREVS
jgi:hypothetical protein